jgi:hypothetical protein
MRAFKMLMLLISYQKNPKNICIRSCHETMDAASNIFVTSYLSSCYKDHQILSGLRDHKMIFVHSSPFPSLNTVI